MNEKLEPTLVRSFLSQDDRGTFSKPISPTFPSTSPPFEVIELYWSKSSKGTIRGMHFQVSPFDGWKAVWVSKGSICDVVLDVNHSMDKPVFHEFYLNEQSSDFVLIPPGFAHGFQSLEEDSIVNYAVSSMYSPEHDKGIKWNSFGYIWPEEVTNISKRDTEFPTYSDFIINR